MSSWGSAEELLKTSAEILSEQFHIAPKLAGRVANAKQSHSFQIEKRILAETHGIQLFCPDSSGFPLRLQHISTPPTVLYWKGNLQDAEKAHVLLLWVPEDAQFTGNNKHAG